MRKSVTFIAGLATAAALAGCVTTTDSMEVTQMAAPATSGFGGLLNANRAASGLVQLAEDAALSRAASGHAADMTRSGYFSHTSPSGGSANARMLAAGGCRSANAENIAEGQSGEAQVLADWMASPSHKRNMMNSKYNRFGLGRSGNTWVLVLAGPCV